jgi:hypothetical protein
MRRNIMLKHWDGSMVSPGNKILFLHIGDEELEDINEGTYAPSLVFDTVLHMIGKDEVSVKVEDPVVKDSDGYDKCDCGCGGLIFGLCDYAVEK